MEIKNCGAVRRIYVEKRPEYDVCSKWLFAELQDFLGIAGLAAVRVVNRYDVQGVIDEQYRIVRDTVFADISVDCVYDEDMPLATDERAFAVEYQPGQYDQRADSMARSAQLFTGGERPKVVSARVIVMTGDINDADVDKIKAYYINPVESLETSFDKPDTLDIQFDTPADVAVLNGFIALDRDGVDRLGHELGMAMKIEDLLFCQRYFRDTEKRDPTITEIRMLDTYWSDHCRHTTFLTAIKNVEIEDAPLNAPVKTAFEMYKSARGYVYGNNIDKKAISLMDIAQMGMRELRKKGQFDDLDVSEEINACSIVVPAVIDGKVEEWLVMFKNETHNHPTEIEPFGGASTCLGGAIRDPLSGRSYVYQAMRVTGAGDPRVSMKNTLPGKLPQRKITMQAAQGYSSYGNQIGIPAGLVSEIYHDGYVAKRMEVGAVVAAAPKSNIVRCEPKAGDIVVLLGGRTGRDGCGGATGSSKEHTEEAMKTFSAEVQKGNPPVERNIQRLFRDPEVSRMIRRCNDFGAGGVSVAIGELAAGLDINLDAVPVKYDGLDGTELAISESQERMAVVIAPADLEQFEMRAERENLETAVVATVTDTRRLKMTWRGKTIVDISRDFIDTNGVLQETEVFVRAPLGVMSETAPNVDKNSILNTLMITEKWRKADIAGAFFETMADINICSRRGIVEMFDSTVGAGTVLMPLGGMCQATPIEAMVAKLPVIDGETTTGTAMSYGFDPYLSSWSPFHGAIYAVLQSAAKITAIGGDYRKIRLTFQEYFEKLGNDKTRWGKPFAALLGAYFAQAKLGIPAIGGKDSMSGTFKDLNVPPTLISFALAPVDVSKVISPEFKHIGSLVVYISIPRDEFEMPDFEFAAKCYSVIHDGITKGEILSAYTIGRGGIIEALAKMCFGNGVGFKIEDGIDPLELFVPNYGGLILELNAKLAANSKITNEMSMKYRILGNTAKSGEIVYLTQKVNLGELYQTWEQGLASVFPNGIYADNAHSAAGVRTRCDKYTDMYSACMGAGDKYNAGVGNGAGVGCVGTDIGNAHTDKCQHRHLFKTTKTAFAKPRVFMPILPGTTCEYDTIRSFTKAGAECDSFVCKNMKSQDIDESVKAISERIAVAQILIVPGGICSGDGPDGSGKFAAAFFRNPRIKDAVTEFLNERDGLMLGIGDGFQTLIKLGLLPYGEYRTSDENSLALTFNTIGRHISRAVYTKIVSVNSPWLTNVNIGDKHVMPISHGEGRFVASPTQLKSLFATGQIATQYVNFDGEFEDGIGGNCTGSGSAVEGLLSPGGRIFGKMGRSERIGENVAKNIYGNKDQRIFEAGVSYFV